MRPPQLPSRAAVLLVVASSLRFLGGCAKPPPLEDVWEVKAAEVDALEKPKASSRIMIKLRAGDIVFPQSTPPVSFEREGKTLSYRRVSRVPDDHAALVPEETIFQTKAPTIDHLCALLGEGGQRRCLKGLARTRLPGGALVLYRASLSEQGLVAHFDGAKLVKKEVLGLRSAVVRTLGGRAYLLVESAVRKEERWTQSSVEVLRADASLAPCGTLVVEEDDTRTSALRYLRTELVVAGDSLVRRGKLHTVDAAGKPQEQAIDEPFAFTR